MECYMVVLVCETGGKIGWAVSCDGVAFVRGEGRVGRGKREHFCEGWAAAVGSCCLSTAACSAAQFRSMAKIRGVRSELQSRTSRFGQAGVTSVLYGFS